MPHVSAVRMRAHSLARVQVGSLAQAFLFVSVQMFPCGASVGAQVHMRCVRVGGSVGLARQTEMPCIEGPNPRGKQNPPPRVRGASQE